VEIYKSVARSGPIRADDLAEKVGKDRSTVYRALQKLMSCGMCFRETKNLEKGGYYHVYGAIPWDILKKRLEQCVQDWYSRMLKVLADFEHQFGNDFYMETGTKEKTL
jgi:predicted transcriptional regulator